MVPPAIYITSALYRPPDASYMDTMFETLCPYMKHDKMTVEVSYKMMIESIIASIIAALAYDTGKNVVKNIHSSSQEDILKNSLKKYLNEQMSRYGDDGVAIIEAIPLPRMIWQMYYDVLLSGADKESLLNKWMHECGTENYDKIRIICRGCIDIIIDHIKYWPEFLPDISVSTNRTVTEIYRDTKETLRLLSDLKENEKKEQIKSLFENILKDIQTNRESDLYNSLSFLNTAVYPYLQNALTDTCSDEIIDLSYYLTDIYDYTSEYDKSRELAGSIKNILMKKQRSGLNVHQLRQLIGCIYSQIIVKTENISQKEEAIKQAEKDYKVVKDIIDKWEWKSKTDERFIISLYNSNYGALLINKALIADEKDRGEYLDEALEHHEKAACLRKEIIERNYFTKETGEKKIVERYYIKSKSNIANVFYHMGKYDDAIRCHREVLRHQIENKEMVNTYITKSYIAGCLAMKKDFMGLTDEELKECMNNVNDCEEFYEKKGDSIRLKNIRLLKEKVDR